MLNETTVRTPGEKTRHAWAAPRAIVRAARRAITRARHVAAFLASEVGSLVDDNLWKASGDNIYNYNSGNVGIGTTAPKETLHIGNTAAITSTQVGPGNALALKFNTYLSGGVNKAIATGNRANAIELGNAGIQFFTSTNTQTADATLDSSYQERMRIDTSGNVGIGTSSPSANLDVGSGTGWIRLRLNGGGTNASDGAAIAIENGSYGYIFDLGNYSAIFGGPYSPMAALYTPAGLTIPYGNVGIGTTDPGSYKLKVAGDGYFSGTLTANGAQVYPGVFTGDSGSGGAAGAVPAPAARDAAKGEFLKADGTWSTLGVRDFLQLLNDGEGYIHSTGTINGILYLGLVINSATFGGPGKLIRMDPASPSAYDVLTYDSNSGHGGIVDWVYVSAKNRIYALFSNGSCVVVAEIALDLSSTTDVINYSSLDTHGNSNSAHYENTQGSLCTDGTNLYVSTCNYSRDQVSHLLAYRLSDWTLINDLLLTVTSGPNTNKSLLGGHNCRCDGTSIFVSSAYGTVDSTSNNLAFVRVALSNLTTIADSGQLPNNTNAAFTDDSSFTDDYVWYGSELSGNIVRVAKSNFASQTVISTGIGTNCLALPAI